MASSLDEEAVRHVAHLARLAVTSEEVACFARQLSKILQFMEQLSEVDTTGVPPTAHAVPGRNVLRRDVVRPPWGPEQALHNAPARRDDFFQVPKVLDRESA